MCNPLHPVILFKLNYLSDCMRIRIIRFSSTVAIKK